MGQKRKMLAKTRILQISNLNLEYLIYTTEHNHWNTRYLNVSEQKYFYFVIEWYEAEGSVKLFSLKQVTTDIGLADTLIPSSVRYLTYMGGTRPCDLSKINFGYHVNS